MKKQSVIDFMKSFETDREHFEIFVSFEHVLVYDNTLKAVQYSDEKGIKDLLEYLVRSGWEAVYEDEILVGCQKEKERITLGVGGQIKWTYGPFIQLADLDQAYLDFIQMLFEELKRRGMILLATGHQPVSSASEIETIPTEENTAYLKYIGDNEKFIDFVKCSATTTVSFQYAHVDNFEKRFQAASIIQPALATLFDNAAWIQGEVNEKPLHNINNIRAAELNVHFIENTLGQSFKYDDFADFLLEAPAIIANGEYVGDKKAEEALNDDIQAEDIARLLRFVKPMVSMNEHGMTIANVDSVPYPLNMAYVLFVKSLLYNPDHITAIQKMIEEIKEENIIASHYEMMSKGLAAPIGQGDTFNMIKDLFFMITLTVEPKEQHYLQPLNSLLFKDVTTKLVTARQFSNILGNV